MKMCYTSYYRLLTISDRSPTGVPLAENFGDLRCMDQRSGIAPRKCGWFLDKSKK